MVCFSFVSCDSSYFHWMKLRLTPVSPGLIVSVFVLSVHCSLSNVVSQRQKLAVTNEISALRRLHPLSWSNNYLTTCIADVSILLS